MVADERLAQADVGDELGDAGLALRQAPHDAQAVHVGEGLVEGAQLARVPRAGGRSTRSWSGIGRASARGGRAPWPGPGASHQRRLISTDVDATRRRRRCQGSEPTAAVDPRPGTLPTTDRRPRSCCSLVFGTGVFLAGLELMITAVALPSILADLVDDAGTSAWTRAPQGELDHQRLPAGLPYRDACRSRGRARGPGLGRGDSSSGALVVFIVGSAHGRPPRSRPAHRGATGAGRGRRRSRSGPQRRHTCTADDAQAPGRSALIGARTFLGMAAGPFLGAPRSWVPCTRRRAHLAPVSAIPRRGLPRAGRRGASTSMYPSASWR